MNSSIATKEQVRKSIPFKLQLSRLIPTSGALHEIASLDGLRTLAILLVIWIHTSEFAEGTGLYVGSNLVRYLADFGFSGVFLFFVLSGFLLFLPYARALLDNRPWPSVRQFYMRRALRILPLYWLSLILLLARLYPSLVQPKNAGALFFGTLLLQDMRVDAFNVIGGIDGPFWTLAVEWQFYLLLPWIALALAKLAGKRTTRGFWLRLMGGLVALIIVGLGIRWLAATMYYAGEQPIDEPGILGFAMKLLYGVKGKYLEVFALGMAASVLYILVVEYKALPERRRKPLGLLALLLSICGLVVCFLWAVQIQRLPFTAATVSWWIFMPPAGEPWQILGEWTLGICFALLLIAVLLGAPGLQRLFAFGPLRYIGIISYSLYVWHVPVISQLGTTISRAAPEPYWLFLILLALVLLFFGSASYYVIERPFIRLRRAAHSANEREKARVEVT